MAKVKRIAEYGDFQTPAPLARSVCRLLKMRGVKPASLVEPTCGLGAFLFEGLAQFRPLWAIGAEINDVYLNQAASVVAERCCGLDVQWVHADFFDMDWRSLLDALPEPILLLGNPPWVTNSELASMDSRNVPEKSNFQKHGGIDAITGKANFDISEWMLIQLAENLQGRRGVLAMLCKSTVARKVLKHVWKHEFATEQAAIYQIDAELHFNAAVDAVLLVIEFSPESHTHEASVFGDLDAAEPESVIGYENDLLLVDIRKYHELQHLCGASQGWTWRSGVKHDCSKVMELRRDGDRYCNGFGKRVELEDTFLFPMRKSSQVAHDQSADLRWMIVTQSAVGENTDRIRHEAPLTWAYLSSYADVLAKRRSSIYRNRPAFSVFGVGEYTFAPWKVAISGFYKKLNFVVVGPVEGKPSVFDDTSYFLPCENQEQAMFLASLLNSPVAQSFFRAFVFWDAKRPITADLLRRLDLQKLASELGREHEFLEHFAFASSVKRRSLRQPKENREVNLTLWPE